MASLIRNLRRKTLILSPKTLIHRQIHRHSQTFCKFEQSICSNSRSQSVRTYYAAEMRKSAFEGNLVRLLRNEIQYELDHSPPQKFVPICGPFAVDERPGEQWITLKRNYEDKEEIKIEVTMFDGSIPVAKKSGSVPGEEDVQMHITIIVNIYKGDGGEVMEFLCSAWPDSVEIQKVFIHACDQNQMPAHPYKGPEFKELDDELQESLYEFLEVRGISDDLAVYLHKYMANKDKTEYIRWMGNVKSFVEHK